jgi:hypothetical protein
MSAAIKQTVTVKQGGVVEIRSPHLHEGDQAEVTVVVVQPTDKSQSATRGGWRRFAGVFHSGDARGGDNERIDADLAAEYGNQSRPEH